MAFGKEASVTTLAQRPTSVFNRSVRRTVFTLARICALVIVSVLSAQAQTFTVIHNFTGGADGAQPVGLTADPSGNLYGTTGSGGVQGGCLGSGCGVVFKLSPGAPPGSSVRSMLLPEATTAVFRWLA